MTPHAVTVEAIDERHVGMVVAHSVRNAAGTKFVLRKGAILEARHFDDLRALGTRELHLVELGPEDLHEDEAGRCLAQAVAGTGVQVRGPSESQYTLVAGHRGLLRVDGESLAAVNSFDGISVLTRFDYQPVGLGDSLAGAKVTPFALPRAVIEGVQAICRERPPLRVRRFVPRRVAAVVLDRVDLRARDRFQAALERKLAWFGSELIAVREAHGGESYVGVIREVLELRPEVIMAAGASSLDPLEPLFRTLRELGAEIVRHGVPVHPGSLFWLARVGTVPLLGLSSCEMFSHKTVLDLVLPRLLAGETVDRTSLVQLGLGGMLGREMAFRFPAYDDGDPELKAD